MPRRTVDVVPVDRDDLRDVTGLWLAARVDSGLQQGGREPLRHRRAADHRAVPAGRAGLRGPPRRRGRRLRHHHREPVRAQPPGRAGHRAALGRARRPPARGRQGADRRRAVHRRAGRAASWSCRTCRPPAATPTGSSPGSGSPRSSCAASCPPASCAASSRRRASRPATSCSAAGARCAAARSRRRRARWSDAPSGRSLGRGAQAPGAASRIRQVIRLVQMRLPSSSVTTTS